MKVALLGEGGGGGHIEFSGTVSLGSNKQFPLAGSNNHAQSLLEVY